MFGSDQRIGWMIFVLALILRLIWAVHLDKNETYWADEDDFLGIAQNMVDGHGYDSRSFRANPTLPFYLAVVEKAVGEKRQLLVGRIGQCVIGAATCLLVWRCAAVLAGPLAGLLAGLILALYPAHVYVSGYFYVDCLLEFLLCLSIYLSLRVGDARGKHPWKWAAACGAALGLTALTRPIFLLGIPCVAAAWVYAATQNRRTSLISSALMCLAAAAVILPWTLRNQLRYHRFMLISSGLGTKLWQGNNELADGSAFDRELYWNDKWDKGGWKARLARLDPDRRQKIEEKYSAVEAQVKSRWDELNKQGIKDDRELAADPILGPLAVHEMCEHPGRTLELFFKKFVPLYSALSPTISDSNEITPAKKWIASLTFYPVLLLGLAGMALAWRQRRRFAVLYLLIVLVSCAYCVLNTCTRFRWPLDPFLIIFAAMAITWTLKSRRWIA